MQFPSHYIPYTCPIGSMKNKYREEEGPLAKHVLYSLVEPQTQFSRNPAAYTICLVSDPGTGCLPMRSVVLACRRYKAPSPPCPISVLSSLLSTMIPISTSSLVVEPQQLAHSAFTYNCIVVSLFALTTFEHVISSHDEISYIWCRRFTPFTLLLLLLRYGNLMFNAIYVASVFATMEQTCVFFSRVTQVLTIFLMTSFCAGSAVQVYALTRNIWLVLLVAILGLGPVATKIHFCLRSAELITSVSSAVCLQLDETTFKDQNRAVIIARLSTTLADLVVLIVTLKATISSFKNARCAHLKVPIVTALIRDGTLFFLIAILMNVIQIIVWKRLRMLYLTPFICGVTSILLSRLFLNLRAASDTKLDSVNSLHRSGGSSPVFKPCSFGCLHDEERESSISHLTDDHYLNSASLE